MTSMLEQPLDVPAVLAELDGQPVEQLGMRGQLAGHAQVARGFDQARAEHFLPEAIDGDARGQRMIRPQQPLGKAQAVARQIGGEGGQDVGRVGFHLVAPLVVLAAEEDEGHRFVGLFLHHVGDGGLGLDLGLASFQLTFALGQLAGYFSSIDVSHQPYSSSISLGVRPSAGLATRKAIRAGAVQIGDFGGGQGAVVDPQILQQHVVEPRAGVALRQLERHARCGSSSSASWPPRRLLAARRPDRSSRCRRCRRLRR